MAGDETSNEIVRTLIRDDGGTCEGRIYIRADGTCWQEQYRGSSFLRTGDRRAKKIGNQIIDE
jgi:hypothetical protein